MRRSTDRGMPGGIGWSGSYDTGRSQPSQRMHRAAGWNGTPVGRSQSVSHAVQCDGRLSVAGSCCARGEAVCSYKMGCIVLTSQNGCGPFVIRANRRS